MQNTFRHILGASLAAITIALPQAALSESKSYIEVSITNVSSGIYFTPILIASHRGDLDLFEPGQAASEELTAIAEGGDIGPMKSMLETRSGVREIAHTDGLLGPGQTATVVLQGKGATRVSLASMMLPTNDGFIALDSVPVAPFKNASYSSPGYDAGTETNDELCISIPGPMCGGEGLSPSDDGEGYVHINRGIHGIGNLVPADHDWRNPVARITIKRTRHNMR